MSSIYIYEYFLRLLITATTLAGRYDQASERFEEADEYFAKLCTTVDKSIQETWNTEITAAESKRFDTPDAMDIMGTRQPSAAESENLSADETHNSAGEDWISLALTIEERQYVQFFYITAAANIQM